MLLDILRRPLKAFYFSVLVFIFWAFASGFVFEFVRLHMYQAAIVERSNQIKKEIVQLQLDIEKFKDREFIRKHAIENLGLAGKNDLIFLFPYQN